MQRGFVGATVVPSPQGWQYNCHPNIHNALTRARALRNGTDQGGLESPSDNCRSLAFRFSANGPLSCRVANTRAVR